MEDWEHWDDCYTVMGWILDRFIPMALASVQMSFRERFNQQPVVESHESHDWIGKMGFNHP